MDFFKNIILKKEIFGNNKLIEDTTSLHIAFGIDANFTIGTGVLIYSILQHNNNNMVFHIFTDSIYPEDVSRFKELTYKANNISIIIYYVNPNKFSTLPIFFTWSQAMYYRYIISKLLYNITDNILYLDSDILCLNSFENLFHQNFSSNIAGVVSDHDSMLNYAQKAFNLNSNYYFNSGFLIINLINWEKNNISDKAISLLLNKNNFKYYDQDVLNLLLANKTLLLEKKYNTIYHLADMNTPFSNDTIFLHYSGSVKPWQAWGQYHFLTPLWLKYKNNSPWKDVPIFQPKTYKQAKFMTRMSYRNKKFIKSIYWYIKYSFWKIKSKLKV